MSELDKAMRQIEEAGSGRLKQPGGEESSPRRIVVDERTHRVRPENETGSEVTFMIGEKGGRK